MDAEQMAELRSWARRLEAREDDDELRAAGKAIVLLVGELERLQVEASSSEAAVEEAAGGASSGEPEETSLRSRLRRTFGYS